MFNSDEGGNGANTLEHNLDYDVSNIASIRT